MSEIDYCYHTHTKRCGHATGEDEEYVLAAIRNGIKVLGFSDHVMLPGRSQPRIRGEYEQFEDYVNSINALKEKYKGQIEIHLGFEAEYYHDELDYYRDLLSSGKIEYLILGQHCFYDKQGFHWYYSEVNPIGYVKRYLMDAIDGLRSGLFSYMCHPDLFSHWYGDPDNPEIAPLFEELCLTAKEMDIPLEINMGPSRYMGKPNLPKADRAHSQPNYPYPPFWKYAEKVGNKAIIGVDAHAPEHFDVSDYAWAKSYLDAYGLEEVTRLTFRKGK